jgi:hypothetical protein
MNSVILNHNIHKRSASKKDIDADLRRKDMKKYEEKLYEK